MDRRSKSAAASRTASPTKAARKPNPKSTLAGENVAATHARELAWTGQHERAVAACSDALAHETRADARLDLLDMRAESQVALGRFDDAAADAAAMIAIASAMDMPAARAVALNRRALVEMRQGKLDDAVTTAKRALASARSARSERLHADSLYRLAEAQMRLRHGKVSIDSALDAAERYRRLGDASGEGRALWLAASGWFRENRPAECRKLAHHAIALCRQAGDLYGIGNALNALSFQDVDVADNIRHLQQAAQAFESAGYLERLMVVHANLGLAYRELGLYRHSLRIQQVVIEQCRRIGSNALLVNSIAGAIAAALDLGDVRIALTWMPELMDLVPPLHDPSLDVGLLGARALLARATSDFAAAAEHFAQGARLATRVGGSTDGRYLTLAGHAHLLAGNVTAALAATAQASTLHRAQGYPKPDAFSGQEIWWRHAQALRAAGSDIEAAKASATAYRLLCQSCRKMRDEGLRRNYLNKVDANREIIADCIATASERRGAKRNVLAHLAIESNPREPFQRLVDTGLRLNALRTQDEIRDFVVEEATELCGGERVMLIVENDGVRSVANAIVPRGEASEDVLAAVAAPLDAARRSRSAELTYAPASGKALTQRSRIVAPLLVQNRLLGYLYADLDGRYGRFNDADRDLLGMFANQAAVALDNAQWAEGLERKVAERTTELTGSNASLAQRNNELAIINSIQQGLASELDFRAIVDLVGDKLRELFHRNDASVRWIDPETGLWHYLYECAKGVRQVVPPSRPKPGGPAEIMAATRRPLVLNTVAEADALGLKTVPGGWQPKSSARRRLRRRRAACVQRHR